MSEKIPDGATHVGHGELKFWVKDLVPGVSFKFSNQNGDGFTPWHESPHPTPLYPITPLTIHSPWTGEGLPPVGADCEIKNDIIGCWDPVDEVLVHTTIAGISTAVCKRQDRIFLARVGELRPIRTSEQIAAEERASEVRRILDVMPHDVISGHTGEIVEWMLYHGYRKTSTEDN